MVPLPPSPFPLHGGGGGGRGGERPPPPKPPVSSTSPCRLTWRGRGLLSNRTRVSRRRWCKLPCYEGSSLHVSTTKPLPSYTIRTHRQAFPGSHITAGKKINAATAGNASGKSFRPRPIAKVFKRKIMSFYNMVKCSVFCCDFLCGPLGRNPAPSKGKLLRKKCKKHFFPVSLLGDAAISRSGPFFVPK